MSHCDNEEKLSVLKKNLKILNNLSNIEILLTSHIPLPEEIISQVDYFVYDKSNPILSWPIKATSFWKDFSFSSLPPLKLHYIDDDYGWTVLNQIILGSSTLINLKEYYNYCFINYDLQLTLEIQETLISPSESLVFNVYDSITNALQFGFGIILIKLLSKDIKNLLPIINQPAYLKFPNAETYLKNLLSNVHYNTSPIKTYDQVRFNDLNRNYNNSPIPNFKFFYSNYNFNSNKLNSLLIYDVESSFDCLINNTQQTITTPILLEDVTSFKYNNHEMLTNKNIPTNQSITIEYGK
tara:strand:- start:471 stop:1358 length:888 start_codon:yes stop_codon:yes gene_type:complete